MAHVPKSEPPAMAAAAAVKASPARPSGVPDDRELVRLAQADDKEAFEELVRRHQHRVFAVAGGILRRREDVEDIAQQVFVKAYFSLKRFDQRAALSTWLYKITVNECWDLLRKKKVRPLSMSPTSAKSRLDSLTVRRSTRILDLTPAKHWRCGSTWTVCLPVSTSETA